MKKLFAVFVISAMFASVFMMASASAIKVGRMDWQIRSGLSRIFHPGNLEPYFPPMQGPNHAGVSDYSPRVSQSELCEPDWQLRPFNQGLNIVSLDKPAFFSCSD